jgi:cysteine desulfurase
LSVGFDDVVFLDANASAPLVDEARVALLHAIEMVGNPSSTHRLGRRARRLIDDAREQVAGALGGEARDVTFVSGASEANRWLVDAVAGLSITRGRPTRVFASTLEHPSLARALAASHARGVIDLTTFAACEDGRTSPLPRDGVDVVFITAAHNETGLLPDLEALLAQVSDDAIVCVDAAQAVARLDRLPPRVDAVVCSGHKMGAPAGTGALLRRGRARVLLAPWAGGAQEGGLRPGTEALVLIAALGAAASVVDETRVRSKALAPVRDRFEQIVIDETPGVRILARSSPRLPQTSALAFADVDGDALRIETDRRGLMVGFGAACSALAPEPSPALLALGLDDRTARATVRVSLAPGLDEDRVIDAAHTLSSIVRSLRARDVPGQR